jgi:hypothetical protein
VEPCTRWWCSSRRATATGLAAVSSAISARLAPSRTVPEPTRTARLAATTLTLTAMTTQRGTLGGGREVQKANNAIAALVTVRIRRPRRPSPTRPVSSSDSRMSRSSSP